MLFVVVLGQVLVLYGGAYEFATNDE